MKKIIDALGICLFIYLYVFKAPAIEENLSQKLSSITSEVKNVNYGGCGYTALYISDYLDRKAIKYEIVQFSFGKYPYFHIMIRVRDTYIDANGFLSSVNYVTLISTAKVITKQDLRFILTQDGWNDDFNKKDTAIIKKILQG